MRLPRLLAMGDNCERIYVDRRNDQYEVNAVLRLQKYVIDVASSVSVT